MLSSRNVTRVPLAWHKNMGFTASHIPNWMGHSIVHPSNSIRLKLSRNCGHRSSAAPSHPDQEKCVKLPSNAKVDDEGWSSTSMMDGKKSNTVWNTPDPKRVKINTRVYEPWKSENKMEIWCNLTKKSNFYKWIFFRENRENALVKWKQPLLHFDEKK